MNFSVSLRAPAFLLLGICLGTLACDDLFTEAPDDADLFDAPLDGLTQEELAAFARGDAAFGAAFTAATGLGPIFNNSSCAGCHSGDGRGRPENALLRFGEAPDFARDLGGPQLQDKAIPGAVPEEFPGGIPFSIRLPPPVFGVGLIEGIPAADIVALSDPDDADGDGISGRPNWVTPAEFVPESEPGGGSGPQLGRFSRKAQVSTLLQQSVEAYHQDMGITSDFLPQENLNPQAGADGSSADAADDPEVSAATVQAVLAYLRMLAPPAPGEETAGRARGRDLFGEIRCAACHVPELRTGPNRVNALSNKPVPLYSDLLLHDMGEELADDRSDGSADGREWRTAPLWGLRIMREFLDGEAFLLHDGRALSVEEAILAHGGEAEGARKAFEGLSAEDRAALLDFVESL